MDALKASALAMGKQALTKVTGTELEKKIAEACSNKPWGASTTMMSEIAQSTYDYQEYPVVMSGVWKKVGDSGKNPRVMYKALALLEYLVRNGSERAVEDARDHMYQLRSLCDFSAHGEGKDEGLNVREISKKIVELLGDRERLKEEREKARQNRGKFGGVGRDGMSSGGSGMRGFGSDSGERTGCSASCWQSCLCCGVNCLLWRCFR